MITNHFGGFSLKIAGIPNLEVKPKDIYNHFPSDTPPKRKKLKKAYIYMGFARGFPRSVLLGFSQSYI